MLHSLRNLALVTVALAAAFSGLVVLGAAVPNARIVAHLREAGPALGANYHPSPLTGGKVDVYTDCVALGNGIAPGPSLGLWTRAMASPVIGHCGLLAAWLAGGPPGVDYFRYWNGYSAFTRPLLWVAGYGPLRALTTAVCLALLATLLALTWRWLGRRVALCLAAALAFAGVDVAVVSVVHSLAWSLAAVFGCWALLADPARLWRAEVWCVAGALTTFLELLNNPLVTLTLPLALALLRMHQEAPLPARQALRVSALAAGSWAWGYFGLWGVKFVLAWATLGPAALTVISDKALEKVSGATALGAPSPLLAILVNLEQLAQPGWRVALLLPLGALLLWRLIRPRPASFPGIWAALTLVGLLPLAWYAAFANHSIVHAWFTCRLLAPTLLLLLAAGTGGNRASFGAL